MSAVLDRLLSANASLALGHKGTVNHLPMALVALHGMGADDARLQAYYDWWLANVAIPRHGPETPVDRASWTAARGQGAAFHPLAAMFEAWIEEAGEGAVIAAAWPHLERAPGTLAFHAVIRLAYGLEAGHRGEIAAGLAAWASAYRDLDLPSAAPCASVAEGLGRIAAAVGGRPKAQGSITGALIALGDDAAFRAVLPGAPAQGAALLAALAPAALRLYWATRDFTVLHMATAVHAARVIAERHPVATPVFAQSLWGAWCAAYVSVGAPPLVEVASEADLPPWPAIFAAAVASDDDHVIKMTWTCHEEAARYGDLLYRQTAARLALGEVAAA